MSISRWLVGFAAFAAVMGIGGPASLATRNRTTPQAGQQRVQKAADDAEEIVQEFPGDGEQKTAWKVHYRIGSPRPGLLITGAWFKTGPSAPWFSVLGEARLSEIFVPYNNGTTRIYDIGAQGNYDLIKHTQADAGVHGQLLHDGLVVKEIRDTGVLWKYYDKVRRGQKLVLWSTLAAANYNYLIEFGFGCDGGVTFRLGATGKNLGNHETMGHMHNGCWRIDVDLGDRAHNSVAVVRRKELQSGNGAAEDIISPIRTEGGVEWKAEEFTRLRVDSNIKNALGNLIAYDFVPERPGTPRHFGQNEDFTAKDFWVTPYKVDQLYYCQLPEYVKAGRKVADTDVVIWYMSPAYHLPRDEDGLFVNPRGNVEVRGVAMTTWCGLEMRPRNMFDKSPLYP